MCVPRNFVRAAVSEHRVFDVDISLSRVALHVIGIVHPHDTGFRQALSEKPRQPTRAAAHVEDVIVRGERHQVKNGQRDGKMIFLEALAPAIFGPAIEFRAQIFVGVSFRRHEDIERFFVAPASALRVGFEPNEKYTGYPSLHRLKSLCYFSTFASSSTNFCWRSDWSLPSSASACCVMFIEQNFGPHIEQNFASL